MKFNLKSIKILHILPNGCVYFDYSSFLKTYAKYNFAKKSLFLNSSNKKKLTSTNSNFFYKKYRNKFQSEDFVSVAKIETLKINSKH
jgi:hypothetical protein